MSYIAKVNGETFFRTDSDDPKLALSSATLNLKAGTAGTFEFKAETPNKKYGTFRKNIDYIDVYRNDETVPIFSGRVGGTVRDFYMGESITAEGGLSYFSDSVFRPLTHEGNLGGYLNLLIDNHNSQVESAKRILLGLIEIDRTQACYRELQNYETTISRLQDLAESFGGYLSVRKAANGNYYLDWLEDFNDGTSQRIDFGENLIDLSISENLDEVYTMLIPLGAEDEETGMPITIESVNSGKDYILADQTYINRYGYVVGVVKWDDVTIPANLKTKAQAWMEENLKPRITIDVTAADLADCGYSIDNFKIGQKILVNSPPHGIENEWFSCTEQSLDLLDPANNTLTLGEVKIGYVGGRSADVTDKVMERIGTKYVRSTEMENAIENATTLITGNQGGYVVLYDSDLDDYPDEILVMDNLHKDNARKIWRWNKSGLGYSKDGYNGPYGLAMTIDGSIVADFITSGYMHGDRITAGTITVTQLGKDAVTEEKILNGSVKAVKIADGAVTANKIDTGAVTVTKIASNAVTAEKILSGAVTAVKIEDGAVTANKIHAGAVNADKIAANCITSAEIASGAITTDELAAGAVTANKIQSSTITADQIAGNTITAAEIAANAITSDELAANAVTASKIAAGAITADDISTGTMSADRIQGGTISIGGGYRTALDIYNSDGYKVFDIDDGYITSYDQRGHYTGSFGDMGLSLEFEGSCSDFIGGELHLYEGRHYGAYEGARLSYDDDMYYNYLPVLEVEGDCTVCGDFSVNGSKNRIVTTADYEERRLYAYETATPMFGDVGEGVVGEDGLCYILIDSIYLQTIQNSQYQVFIQKYAEGECYVSKRTPSFFIVSGTPGVSFGWEIKARQYDRAQRRIDANRQRLLEKRSRAKLSFNGDNNNYARELTTHIEEVQQGRRIV